MTAYFIRRFLYTIPLMLVMTAISFAIIELAPGDFVSSMMRSLDPNGERYTDPVLREALEKRYGFDQPAHIRYLKWLRGVVFDRNLGTDLNSGRPVLEELTKRWPLSLRLQLTTFFLTFFTSIALGVISAVKQYSLLDYGITFFGLIWISVPTFVFAIFVLYLFAARFPIFPVAHDKPVGVANPSIWQLAYHMVLPVFVLAAGGIAGGQRSIRALMLEQMGADYARTARAKGLSERVVLYRHMLRNIMVLIVSGMIAGLPGLLGGSYIVEYIFSWPGVGTYGITAAFSQNYPALLGSLLLYGGLSLIFRVLADMSMGLIDPRIRITKGAQT